MYLIIHLFNEDYENELKVLLKRSGMEAAFMKGGEVLFYTLLNKNPLFAEYKKDKSKDRKRVAIFTGEVTTEVIENIKKELMNKPEFDDDILKIITIPTKYIYK